MSEIQDKIKAKVEVLKGEFAKIEELVKEKTAELQQMNNEILNLRVEATAINRSIQDLESL